MGILFLFFYNHQHRQQDIDIFSITNVYLTFFVCVTVWENRLLGVTGLWFIVDDAENNTSKSHGPRTLLMAPAQQQKETILVEGTGVVPAKCSPKIKSELFSLL